MGGPVTLRLVLAWVIAAVLVGAGAAGAAPYTERTGQPPSAGVMLLFHGGGWMKVGADYVRVMDEHVDRFDDAYHVRNATYALRVDGVTDALAVYDAARADAGPDVPICAMGESAGGHLALMIAAQRDLACVIAHGAPTDLGAMAINHHVIPAFGPDPQLWIANSPVHHTIAEPVLMAAAEEDPTIPAVQSTLIPGAEVHLLRSGTAWFVHQPVDAGQRAELFAREAAFVADAMGAWQPPPPPPPDPPVPPPPPPPPPRAPAPAPPRVIETLAQPTTAVRSTRCDRSRRRAPAGCGALRRHIAGD